LPTARRRQKADAADASVALAVATAQISTMFDRDNNLLPTADQNEDPRVWLEGVEDAGALDWVRSWNAHATSSLGDPKGSATYTKILEILDSKEKIPYVGRVLDGLYYNFWQDDVHVKGIWRRCTLAEYRKEAPAWEVVLDLDALGKAEGITWVWAGSTVLDEGAGVAVDRVLLKLSNGGSDASHVREFDLKAKAFVAEADGGFVVGEAKTQMVYKDRDTLLIGTDLGEGSLTDSGYPRTVREWKRGTKLADAPLVFEGKKTDVLAFASYYRDRHVWHAFTRRMITFWTSEHKWRTPSGEYEKVPVQEDAKM
jgi:prolyl oligopeptidase